MCGNNFIQLLNDKDIKDIECFLPDMNGISRGKSLSKKKFLSILNSEKPLMNRGLKLPETIFGITLNGEFISSSSLDVREPDLFLLPDTATGTIMGSAQKAIIICDACDEHGDLLNIAPRSILKHVISLYEQNGWQACVAPELELYIVPQAPHTSPKQKTPYGSSAMDHIDEAIDIMKACAAEAGLMVDTILREGGAGQVEINVSHTDPLTAADQLFLLKKVIRAGLAEKGFRAIFMAKPFDDEPASALHIHQSIFDIVSGENIFAGPEKETPKHLLNFIGGMQKYIPALMPFFAPNLNSYRRLQAKHYGPTNLHWAHENRTVGLRIPASDAENTRVENRIPGVDVNPYLAIAATLAAGYLGMTEGIEADGEMTGNAYQSDLHKLPRHILPALDEMQRTKELEKVFPAEFIQLYIDLKYAEYEEFLAENTPWENDVLRDLL